MLKVKNAAIIRHKQTSLVSLLQDNVKKFKKRIKLMKIS